MVFFWVADVLKIENEHEQVHVALVMSKKEFKQLAGELSDLLVVARGAASTPARVSMRGKNEATKYFLIPRSFRKGLSLRGKVSCQRIDTCAGSTFIYHLANL